MRKFLGVLCLLVGVVGFVGSLLMTYAPLPAVPRVSVQDVNYRDGPEVAAARAKLYEAEVKQYRQLEEEDRAKMAARPEHERWWPVYLCLSIVVFILGLVFLGSN